MIELTKRQLEEKLASLGAPMLLISGDPSGAHELLAPGGAVVSYDRANGLPIITEPSSPRAGLERRLRYHVIIREEAGKAFARVKHQAEHTGMFQPVTLFGER
ncbi:MAG: hypothetical protein L0Y72_06520, partial [Gemmataceae bacterium]|nr:hypothetical protein [Gemmataceae bacterium]MCI0738680.1 hypothetical protein [Gemmataceae bacterium]